MGIFMETVTETKNQGFSVTKTMLEAMLGRVKNQTKPTPNQKSL